MAINIIERNSVTAVSGTSIIDMIFAIFVKTLAPLAEITSFMLKEIEPITRLAIKTTIAIDIMTVTVVTITTVA